MQPHAGNAAPNFCGPGRDFQITTPTEGGHTDFAPNSDQEIDLLRYVRSQYLHVSYERVLSGPGLLSIYEYLRDAKKNEPTWLAEKIKAGDPAAQSPVQAAHPDKDAYMTECSGGDWEPLRSGGLTLQARRLIVQSVRHGARGVLFWNLALDLQGGPHAGGCGTCRGVVDIDPRGERVVRSDEYYALAHASRFVRPQAWRIDSSEGGEGMDNVAFLNPDGARVLVVVNSADRARVVTVAEGARGFRYSVPARSLASFVWPAPAAGAAR